MIDGRPLVDVHLHAARLPTLKQAWQEWAHDFGEASTMQRVYDADGTVDPAGFDAYLADEGVDVALVLAEYSPKVTGIQPVEDLLPLTAQNPDRVKLIANVNPHLHYPIDEELQRQLDLGAVACKIHPVHAGAPANDRALYPAYELCQSAGIPVVVHCGTSTFPGSANASPTRCCSTTCCATSAGSRSRWRTAAAAGGTTRRRSWRCPTSGSGSSCPGCRRRGCASTTPSTTGTGWSVA